MTFALYENDVRLELAQEEFEDFILEELHKIVGCRGISQECQYYETTGKFSGLKLAGVLTQSQASKLWAIAGGIIGEKEHSEPFAKTESAQRKQIRDILNANK